MINVKEIDLLFRKLNDILDNEESLTVVGGASMAINYGSRLSTDDVDVLHLPDHIMWASGMLDGQVNWLNDNVSVTKSFSRKLEDYKVLYRDYGKLKIYTVSGLPLLCMKLVAFREDSHDLEDCATLVEKLKPTTLIYDVMEMIATLYGTTSILSIDAESFIRKEFGQEQFMLDAESLESYEMMLENKLIEMKDLPEQYIKQIQAYRERKEKKKRQSEDYDMICEVEDCDSTMKFIMAGTECMQRPSFT